MHVDGDDDSVCEVAQIVDRIVRCFRWVIIFNERHAFNSVAFSIWTLPRGSVRRSPLALISRLPLVNDCKRTFI